MVKTTYIHQYTVHKIHTLIIAKGVIPSFCFSSKLWSCPWTITPCQLQRSSWIVIFIISKTLWSQPFQTNAYHWLGYFPSLALITVWQVSNIHLFQQLLQQHHISTRNPKSFYCSLYHWLVLTVDLLFHLSLLFHNTSLWDFLCRVCHPRLPHQRQPKINR